MNPKLHVSRRDFLKVSSGAAATCVLGEMLFGEAGFVFADQSAQAPGAASEQVIPSYCKMCIGPACGMLVHVKDGVVTHVTGDPDHVANEGRLCPRGNANVYNLYNPYRLKAPLKRTNPEKGLDIDPGWVEISWDEALATMTEKLSAILHDDPRKLVFHTGFGSMRDDMPMGRPVFQTAFGTPNSIESNGPLCPVHFGALSGFGSFTYSIDPIRTNYLVCIGHSPGGDFAKASCGAGLHGVSTTALQNALDRGLKLVVVNPHAGSETVRGEWVPIIPGTDLAFILAMTHVILHELDTYDEWFLRVRTNAPYLIKEDGAYARDPETNKPLLWDTASARAVPFDDPSVSGGRLDTPEAGAAALTGEYEIDGQAVRTAFEVIKEQLQPYTPEWAEEITTIPAAKIRQITEELVRHAEIGSTVEINGVTFPKRPALVFAGRGAIAHRGGNYVMMAGNLINALIGACDVPGGITGESFMALPQPGPDGTVEPNIRLVAQAEEWVRNEFKIPADSVDMAEFYPHRHCTPFVAWRSIVDPEKYYLDYQPEAMIVFGANPLTNNVNREEAIAAFKKLSFIATISYHLDEPTQFADIVLPESANMERLNFFAFQSCGAVEGKRGAEGFNFRFPVVEPLYDTRDANTILMDLGNRLGINPPMNGMLNGMQQLAGTPYELEPPAQYTWEEVVERILKARFGDDKGIDYFKEHGAAWTGKLLPEEQTYNYYYFPDGQTRHPIYSDYLRETGKIMEALCAENGVTVPGWDMDKYLAFFQPLPTWIPHPEHEAAPEYDLFAVNWKIASRAFGMGALEELAPVRAVQRQQNPEVDSIWMNTQTAHEKGLKEGDAIQCESQYGGIVTGVVHTTGLLHLKAVGFPGNFGRQAMFLGPESKKGPNYNQLLSAADGEFDPVAGGIEITAALKVTKL